MGRLTLQDIEPRDEDRDRRNIASLQAWTDLLVEADSIEAIYGPNAYSGFLRQHGCRPDATTAEGIGRFLGGRVKASDGKMYPVRNSK